MEQYIPKSALVAEIKRRINEINLDTIEDWRYRLQWEHDIEVMKNILSLINTLEVKEVDLEKELESWRHNHFHGRRDKEASGEYLERISQLNLAKHFFELGMCVNNPITATDRDTAEEIIINLKRIEQDYRIDLTKEIEWLRNKVKKGD